MYNGKLVGIANGNKDGCGSVFPDLFADVFAYGSWINLTMHSN